MSVGNSGQEIRSLGREILDDLTIRSYRDSDLLGVVALWKRVFPDDPPWNDPEQLVRRKLRVQRELFFIAEFDASIVGTVIAGFDGVRGWVHKVATDSSLRRKRIATQLMAAAEAGLIQAGCTKLNLRVRAGNESAARFYETLGYSRESRISMSKRLERIGAGSLTNPAVRPQYHFRKTESGLDAWAVERLISLSKDLPIKQVNPASFKELDSAHWYLERDAVPSPKSIMMHMGLIQSCDLAFPIILDQSGRVMDGMHRVCKAILCGVDSIAAVQFEVDPPPDFVDCDPRSLPYEQ